MLVNLIRLPLLGRPWGLFERGEYLLPRIGGGAFGGIFK
jgi:hypothetical protein